MIFWSAVILLIAVCISRLFYLAEHRPSLPENTDVPEVTVVVVDSSTSICGSSWLHRNEHGLWELYAEGSPLERGATIGALCQPLIEKQERTFINQIKKIIPSERYLGFLRLFIGWFNRSLGSNIPEEYKEEIFAASTFSSPSFSYIGTPYQRQMNYHAAHDIGHALQSMGFVGCTSFAVWGAHTADSSLLIGRNFDFYVGDEFAEDKIVAFINPEKGYKHMFVTWGGMFGVVSGMNEHGLTVTLNASNTGIPFKSATPVSIIAREILQFASNIEEAAAIAGRKKSFVSEQFLIGSASDKRAVIIEKTKSRLAVFQTKSNQVISANHFQTKLLGSGKTAIRQRDETASGYRYKTVGELIDNTGQFEPLSVAEILRNTRGHGNADIGLGNEKAVNQLIAHHSVIFDPARRVVWVSTNPYQMGAFIAYNLDSVFNSGDKVNFRSLADTSLTIPADSLFIKRDYPAFKTFRKVRENLLKTGTLDISDEMYINLNPNSYQVYSDLGDYHFKKGSKEMAIRYYTEALSREIASVKERISIEKQLKRCMK